MASRTVSLPGVLKRALSESHSDCSDQQLLSRFADSGDEAAFAAILDRHGPMLYGTCRRLLDDSHLADDVLQATFLLLARQCRSIRQRDSLAGWLYRVAQRLSRQARLAETARSNRERLVAANRPGATERDPGWDELCLVLDEELRRLPERYRVPLLLCYLEGRTQDEAAKQLGCNVRTLRRRLDRARNLLKSTMVRRGATLGAGLFASFLAPSAANAILTPHLRQSILSSATGTKSAVISATALGMANSAVRMATVTRIAVWSALALAMGGAAAGLFQLAGLTTEARQPAAQPAQPPPKPDDRTATAPIGRPDQAPAAGRDRSNEPLPDGAVSRLGTVAFRHGANAANGGSLTFAPDGKQLVSMGGGWVRRWDLETGKETVSLGDGWAKGVDKDWAVTPDGKAAWLFPRRQPMGGLRAGTKTVLTQYDLESGKERRTIEQEFARSLSRPVFAPDGKMWAEFRAVYNAADGTLLHSINVKDGGTYTTLVFTPDGKSLVFGDDQHTLCVFDLTTGKEARSFGTPDEKGTGRPGITTNRACAAISPDGNHLATAGARFPIPESRDHSIVRIWDLAKGTKERTFNLPKGSVAHCLVFTSDSSTLIAGSQSGGLAAGPSEVYSWDVGTGKPARSWTDNPLLGSMVAVSPNGKVLATMNGAGLIRLWDRATGKDMLPRPEGLSALRGACFRPDGKTILTVDDDLAVREWDAASGRSLGPALPKAKDGAKRFLAGGKFLIGESAEKLWLQDAATGKVLLEAIGALCALAPDGKRLAMSDQQGRTSIYDIESATVVRTLSPDGNEPKPAEGKKSRILRSAVGFSADGKSLVSYQGDIVSVWDVNAGTRQSSWSLKENKVLEASDSVSFFAVSADGATIAFDVYKSRVRGPGGDVPTRLNRLTLVETATGKVIQQSDFENENRLEQITFSPAGNLVAVGGWVIRVWDVKTGKQIHRFDGHRGLITSLAFSPDGRRLVSTSGDTTALVWDVSK